MQTEEARVELNYNITWRCRVRSPDGKHDAVIPAIVPGCVHTDLIRAGLVPDPFWRDNNEQLQWIEDCDVDYIGIFTVETIPKSVSLVFRGLDTYASVTLNGVQLGTTDDMFVSYEFDVSTALKPGENVLLVSFRSPVREVAGLPRRSGAFTVERLYTRRVQCTYGWDWVGRFVTMGIWKPVEFIVHGADHLADGSRGIYVFTKAADAYSAQIAVDLAFEEVTGSAWADMTIVSPDGTEVWTKRRRILAPRVTETIDIRDPQLWYPAGYGAQPLYLLTVRVFQDEAAETPAEECSMTFGIRTVRIAEIGDIPGSEEDRHARKLKETKHLQEWDRNESTACFWLIVNGIRVFCQGANWVPSEPFPSAETPEKIGRLVALAKEAGVNMLRVWGGGVFAPEALCDACDRAGIMLTQDFLMACGDYPEEDPAFLEKLRLEAREAALTMRNHPCLVWWTGDNENAVRGDENAPKYNGREAALSAIGPVLSELDPARRFLPSSPYGGTPYASGTRGTTHNTQFLGSFFAWVRAGEWSGYREYFDSYLNRFVAEQPAAGLPFVSSLRKFMTDDDIFGDDTSISEYHTKNNPGLGAITLYGYLDRMARGIFGDYTDGRDRMRKMQYLQCEWIRLSVELHRRNAWYSSGMIYWMWNDCWSAANGWSMVDWYGFPKPAYYAFARAAKPVIASVVLRDELTDAPCVKVYVSHNCAGGPAEGTLRLYRYDIVTGAEDCAVDVAVSVPAGKATLVYRSEPVPLSHTQVLIADLVTNRGADRAFTLPSGTRFADMPFVSAAPVVAARTDEYVEVTAPVTLPFALVDPGDVVLAENGAFLKKGETVRYAVRTV